MNHKPTHKIVEEYSNMAWKDKSIDNMETLIHEDIIIHSSLGDFHGIKAFKEVVKTWLKAFPDLHVTNEQYISEKDLVSVQWRATGSHQGEFKGRQPTGKSVSYKGATVYRVLNNKIVEYWAYLDIQHVLNQL